MDDIFCLFKNNYDIDPFLDYINSVNSNIQFTKELFVDCCIPFLDVNVKIVDSHFLFNTL
mgnify:CR=1 FL=1